MHADQSGSTLVNHVLHLACPNPSPKMEARDAHARVFLNPAFCRVHNILWRPSAWVVGIQSATVNAADLMGWSDRTGSLDPGKWADLIAVDGDPLADVKLLQDVKFVMKAGTVYKSSEK